MSCGVGHRHGSDPVFLWLWYRPAATALIRPLTWEPPYATSAALKRQKDQKKKKFLPRLTIYLSLACFQLDAIHHYPKASDSCPPMAARPGAPAATLTAGYGDSSAPHPCPPSLSAAGDIPRPCLHGGLSFVSKTWTSWLGCLLLTRL